MKSGNQNPFESSGSGESIPEKKVVRYSTRSLKRRTGAADDTDKKDVTNEMSPISGLVSLFM